MSGSSKSQPDLFKVIAAGAVLAGVLGYRSFLEANQTTEQKRASRKARQEGQARSKARKKALERASELQKARWQQFKNDKRAQAAIDAEYYFPIIAGPIAARVSTNSDITRDYTSHTVTAATDQERMLIVHYQGAGPPSVSYQSSRGKVYQNLNALRGKVLIGEVGSSSASLYKRMAGLLAAMQREGHFAQLTFCLQSGKRRDIAERHYAAYARARGWPEKLRGVYD